MHPFPPENQTGRYHQQVRTRAKIFVLTTDALGMTRFEIVATLVTFEQENLISPIRLSFRTIQKLPIERGITLLCCSSYNPTVLWRDYLIGSFARTQPRTYGLYIWSMGENSIFYFEVCHSIFPFPGASIPNSRQMESVPHCTKIFDDVLFVKLSTSHGIHWNTAYCCIHIPSLVISAQLPGGSLSLTRSAFDALLPKCIMQSHVAQTSSTHDTKIYSIPACPPTYPRYCFIIRQFPRQEEVKWDVIEVEMDLSIPGPIKVFSRVSQQYDVQRPTDLQHDINDNLLLSLPLAYSVLQHTSLSVQFLPVGKPGKMRMARFGGVDTMHLFGPIVDRDAGYVILWAGEVSNRSYRGGSYIWWLDESKSGDMVYSRKKELKSSWSRRLLRGWKGSLCRYLS